MHVPQFVRPKLGHRVDQVAAVEIFESQVAQVEQGRPPWQGAELDTAGRPN
jgi:hypothetical protein